MDTDKTTETREHIWEATDGTNQYVLHPEGDELFTRTGRQVIEACRLNISIEVWLAEFVSMRERVAVWAKEHAAQVSECFAVPCGLGLGVFVVPQSAAFDFDLADKLADLNRELVQSFNVGTVEVHQVPAEELDRFIIRDAAIQVYPHANSAHQPVEA